MEMSYLNLSEFSSKSSEKGQKEELDYLYDTISGKLKLWPISLEDLIQTTEITFIANNSKE
jgi:hypothetical protein